MFDNWGYNDPGDMPEPFNPYEADEALFFGIMSGELVPPEA